MGYYTGQIFEIKAQGSAHSVAGGGRYDKMVGKLTGRDVPASGFSIGFERIISILQEQGIKPKDLNKRIAFIYDPDRDDPQSIVLAADQLRKNNLGVSLLPRRKEMKKQIDLLAKQDFTGYVIFKPDNQSLEIRDLEAQ
jgi:histidyl-tRNA synthetase